ncbi:MAG: F0F1 ATP synthase subunit A [Clostridiales Family XIII bacterium]|jgi:F-type H+-transporting ATPase subunit a|nr:F0F1 ATP synthase subunit A [Clostridiales Family XIII bacterium]
MSHDLNNIGPRVIVQFGDSGIYITETVIYGWIVAAVLILLALWSAHNLRRIPKGKQVIAEFAVRTIYNLVIGTMGKHCEKFAPYMGTLFLFLILGNMLGLFGLRPTTADVNMTFALSGATFLIIQYNGFKTMGFAGKLKHMADPYPFMFPLKLIEELSFPISLSFRLFGNIFGGVIIMALIFNGLHGLSEAIFGRIPFIGEIPWLQAVIPLPANAFFDIFEPVLQAFIFTMLTMVFVSMAVVTHENHEH